MQLTQGRGIHNCCLCLFFIGKDFVYLDAKLLYDHIKRETFQAHALILYKECVTNDDKDCSIIPQKI